MAFNTCLLAAGTERGKPRFLAAKKEIGMEKIAAMVVPMTAI